MNKEIEIISKPSESQPFVVIYKPSGLASAPLKEGESDNALFQASKIYPEILNIKGKKSIEHGLIHRIDTLTDGLIVIATTQQAYETLEVFQKENKLIKNYRAKCLINLQNSDLLSGFPERNFDFDYKTINQEKTISSYFRPFGEGHKEVRPVTENSGEAALKKIGKKVIYSTSVKITSIQNEFAFVDCKITNGFRHQVRCHLSWLGLPIIGDPLYNYDSRTNNFLNEENSEQKFTFTAYKIQINDSIFEI